MRRALWWPALAWAAAILVGTSIPGAELPRTPTGVDKLAHFALYAPLGLLVARALRGGGASRGSAVIALAALAVFAAVDELHQNFIPGRSADRIDWLVDVIGAAAGLLILVPPNAPRSEQRT